MYGSVPAQCKTQNFGWGLKKCINKNLLVFKILDSFIFAGKHIWLGAYQISDQFIFSKGIFYGGMYVLRRPKIHRNLIVDSTLVVVSGQFFDEKPTQASLPIFPDLIIVFRLPVVEGLC